MVILVNKKRLMALVLIVAVIVCGIFLYKPYLKKFEYPLEFSGIVIDCAKNYGLDPYLIYSVMKAESRFDKDALSVKGAQGLMQITPQTADWAMEKMNISGDIFEPLININVGSWYLAKMLSDHGGDLTAALAAYNAGSANVNKWKTGEKLTLEEIEFKETHNYVYKTLQFYENYKKLYRED